MPGRPAADGSPLVSVIINCRNGETWLREAIDSVFAQTYGAWEIIFWDNGSTDRSAEIAQAYGPRVRYFLGSEPVPLGAARNLALREAKGDYLAFLDSDDVWLPDTLAKQVAAMEGTGFALCYGGIIKIDERGREFERSVPTHASGDLFDVLLHQFDIWAVAVMIRGSTLRESGLSFDPTITASEEYCLFMQLAVRHPFCVIPEPLAKYRVHDGALTNTSIGRWADEREYTLGLIEAAHPGIRELHAAGFEEAYARARYYRARNHVIRGERGAAIRQMAPTVTVHPRYLALFLMLFLPLGVWNGVHRLRTGRRHYVGA